MDWIIADSSLSSYMGHSFEYARVVRDEVLRRNGRVDILARTSSKEAVIKELGVKPCFRYDLCHRFNFPFLSRFALINGQWGRGWHFWTFYRDLCQMKRCIVINAQTIFLFHTISHPQIKSIAKWAELFPKESCPFFALVLRFSSRLKPSEARFYKRSFNYLQKSLVVKRFALFTDTDMLVEEFKNYTRLPLSILPVPHAQSFAKTLASYAESNTALSKGLHIVYLGDARQHKGFHLLPQVIERLSDRLQKKEICVEIQANIRSLQDFKIRNSVDQLRKLPVKLHEEELSTEDYYSLLSRADIILLPYRQRDYYSQTSGIFCEALARGKVVVVPRDTWMARQIGENKIGVTFLSENIQSLFEALVYTIDHFQKFKTNAQEFSDSWRQHHSSSRYVDLVEAAFENHRCRFV